MEITTTKLIFYFILALALVYHTEVQGQLPPVNYLGAKCNESIQCQTGTPGALSECVGSNEDNKVCQCQSSGINFPEQHFCYKKADLVGEDCQVWVQCVYGLGESSSCYNRKCLCSSNSGTPSEDNRRCLPVMNELGRPCEENGQCRAGSPGALSECTGPENNKTCACLSTAVNYAEQHKCYLKATIVGEYCENTLQCQAGLGPFSTCYNRQCLCSSGAGTPSEDNRRCLPIINELDRECEEDRQCQVGEPGQYSKCTEAEDGTRRCSCLDIATHYAEYHRCYKKATIVSESCENTLQCQAGLGPYSSCYNRECLCSQLGGVPSLDNRRCLPIINELTRECEEDRQCQSGTPGQLSACTELKNGTKGCACLEEAVNNVGQHACLKKAEIVGDPCQSVIQCQAGLGQLAGGTQCYNRQCICSSAIPSDDNKHCLPIVQVLSGACQEDRQCQSGAPGSLSECSGLEGNKTCTCSSNSVYELGKQVCLKKAELVGESCTIQSQCKARLGELSQCDRNVCICSSTAVASVGNDKCLPIINVLGTSCEEDAQCQRGEPGENSECQGAGNGSKTCTCKSDSVNLCPSNKCLRLANIVGDACEEDIQCQEKVGELSYCLGEKCACRENAQLSEDCQKKCIAKEAVNEWFLKN